MLIARDEEWGFVMSSADLVLGFDFDAVSSWIHSWGYADSPAKHARGVFGATVGAPRVL